MLGLNHTATGDSSRIPVANRNATRGVVISGGALFFFVLMLPPTGLFQLVCALISSAMLLNGLILSLRGWWLVRRTGVGRRDVRIAMSITGLGCLGWIVIIALLWVGTVIAVHRKQSVNAVQIGQQSVHWYLKNNGRLPATLADTYANPIDGWDRRVVLEPAPSEAQPNGFRIRCHGADPDDPADDIVYSSDTDLIMRAGHELK